MCLIDYFQLRRKQEQSCCLAIHALTEHLHTHTHTHNINPDDTQTEDAGHQLEPLSWSRTLCRSTVQSGS